MGRNFVISLMLLFIHILFIGTIIMDTTNIRKKIQYITVDSEFVQGSNNTFTVNLGTITGSKTSNVLLQNLRNVIGLKVVDFYITQIASFQLGTDETSQTAIKYIDILCPDIPDAAQILDERKSKIFARVPLERDFSGTSNTVVNDKQWKSFDRLTNYFNPISIRQLNFQIFELTGSNTIGVSGTYQLLQPDASFYMILEVTTIDNDVITLPKEDPTVKVVEAIQSLEEKVVGLPEAMKSFEEKFTILFEQFPEALKSALPEPIPAPAPVVVSAEVPTPLPASIKMDKKMYWIIAIAILVIGYLLMNKK
jgi:hypothetical protein